MLQSTRIRRRAALGISLTLALTTDGGSTT